eukprot:6197125-Pleurochrysis_carterae.AAC.1
MSSSSGALGAHRLIAVRQIARGWRCPQVRIDLDKGRLDLSRVQEVIVSPDEDSRRASMAASSESTSSHGWNG